MTEKGSQQFLEYSNPMVVGRFMKLHKVSEEEAKTIFTELMKFLYICAHIPASSPPSAVVDEMWHCFIIFTADYFDFCAEYVGRFLHHQPTDSPYVGNRPEMLELAVSTFGPVKDEFWYHITKTPPGTLRACDSNYCSENCQADRRQADIEKMRKYIYPPIPETVNPVLPFQL